MKVALTAAALLTAVTAPALAQRPPSIQQQILILQQQLAASQASAVSLSQRLDAVERQLQQLINQQEENGHRVSVIQSNLNQMKSDQDSRLGALEQKVSILAAAPAPQTSDDNSQPAPAKEASAIPKRSGPKSKGETGSATTAKGDLAESSKDQPDSAASATDPAEDAYSQGYHLWADGNYGAAIKALQAFTTHYPNHRRVSWARNLIGRALLDQGQPREAANVFLTNYRADPGGGRAQDSLYYLGQSLMKLGQPGQACKAYAELESVYGTKLRPDISSMLPKAKAEAGCE